MKQLTFPKPLSPGQTIVVCNTSSHVPISLHPRFERVIKDLKTRGFHVIVDKWCLQLATAQEQAEALMRYLTDDKVSAIMPPWGGDLAMSMLPHVDFEQLSHSRPKWLIGFSDVSTLAVALSTLSAWATVHSSNLMQLNLAQPDLLTKCVFNHLSQLNFEQVSSQFAEEKSMSWLKNTNDIFHLTKPTRWYTLEHDNEFELSGRLIGGCLDTLHLSCHTGFFALANWKEKCKRDGTILYLENAELNSSQVHRALLSLKLSGLLDGLSGLILGRDNANGLSIKDSYQEILADLPYPILFNADIGHVAPNMTLINGSLAHIYYSDGHVKLRQSLV